MGFSNIGQKTQKLAAFSDLILFLTKAIDTCVLASNDVFIFAFVWNLKPNCITSRIPRDYKTNKPKFDFFVFTPFWKSINSASDAAIRFQIENISKEKKVFSHFHITINCFCEKHGYILESFMFCDSILWRCWNIYSTLPNVVFTLSDSENFIKSWIEVQKKIQRSTTTTLGKILHNSSADKPNTKKLLS